ERLFSVTHRVCIHAVFILDQIAISVGLNCQLLVFLQNFLIAWQLNAGAHRSMRLGAGFLRVAARAWMIVGRKRRQKEREEETTADHRSPWPAPSTSAAPAEPLRSGRPSRTPPP